MTPKMDMPPKKKQDFRWESTAILLPLLFPLFFYFVYLWRSPSPWKALKEPILVACVLALLACLCGLALRNRDSDSDILHDTPQPKTDWRERVLQVAYGCLVFAGFFFCAFDKGFISGRAVFTRTFGAFAPIVVAEFLKGMYHNDRSPQQPRNGELPSDLPSLPYLIFPSDRKR